MRRLTLFFLVALSVSSARAQEQERKLVDRLLRPNTELQNSAQKKEFVADGTSIDKKATISLFYIQEKPLGKEFVADRQFAAKLFAARHFRDGEIAARVRARAQLARPANINSSTAFSVSDAFENGRKTISCSFVETHSFLDQGKSQKAISQHDTPLTIEEVRELLNKNK